ncbi:MAG: hypothetical protein Q4D96_13775 [Propionibacteriaceae bacterium]|nr:hypothetical protein [Propionibacteriaceae bacterium]
MKNATIVHAWMGYSEDLIGGKFDTPGSHAVMNDGKYYWRYDAIDYLKHYPIKVSETAISHFSSNNWTPPKFELGTPEYSALEGALDEIYDPSNDNDIVIFYPTDTPTDNVN